MINWRSAIQRNKAGKKEVQRIRRFINRLKKENTKYQFDKVLAKIGNLLNQDTFTKADVEDLQSMSAIRIRNLTYVKDITGEIATTASKTIKSQIKTQKNKILRLMRKIENFSEYEHKFHLREKKRNETDYQYLKYLENLRTEDIKRAYYNLTPTGLVVDYSFDVNESKFYKRREKAIKKDPSKKWSWEYVDFNDPMIQHDAGVIRVYEYMEEAGLLGSGGYLSNFPKLRDLLMDIANKDYRIFGKMLTQDALPTPTNYDNIRYNLAGFIGDIPQSTIDYISDVWSRYGLETLLGVEQEWDLL